jgi:hypothetical protein
LDIIDSIDVTDTVNFLFRVLWDVAVHPQKTLDLNLHSPQRLLIELKIGHSNLNALVDTAVQKTTIDELMVRRLKKQRLLLRDRIAGLELLLQTPEPA